MNATVARAGVAAAVAVAALGLAVTGSRVLGDDASGYPVTAYFTSAIGVYPSGDVLVMGLPAGTVDEVVVEDTRIRMELTIDDDVPLPADVSATIEAESVLGERNVTLFPPWSAELEAQQAPTLAAGDVIPVQRTSVPVEPDQGLEAFNELAASLDADNVGELLADSATILDGRGDALGRAIESTADLTDRLAEIDEPMLAAAASLNDVASVLNGRDAQLRQLIDSFGGAVDVLATERDDIRRLLSGTVSLTDAASSLLDVHGEQLPQTIATLAATMGVIENNVHTVEVLIDVLPQIVESFERAYRPDLGGFFLKVDTSAVVETVIEQLLAVVGLYPGEI
jgi:phospholipid/cholesterol/gamma-HCH transport system substrate-binding protein